MGMENYSRSYFTQGNRLTEKTHNEVSPVTHLSWAQMSGKMLEQLFLQYISQITEVNTIAVFPKEFFSITLLTSSIYRHA